MTRARPLRSWMFVPGDRQRFIEKAAGSDADAVFIDMEDGVLPERKDVARTQAAEALGREEFRPRRYVRVNATDTPWYSADVEAMVRPGLDGICLPKTSAPADVTALASSLDRLERQHGVEPGSVRIMAAIESAGALLRADEIAGSDPRLVGLMLGTEDFALDIGLPARREGAAAELLPYRSALVLAAASAHILSVDGVYPDLDDPEGLDRDALLARRLGFTSKSTFNPRQIDALNRIFSPQPEEIEHARVVVTAFEEAQARGEASVAVGGQLVDLPIVLRAQRILELAELEMDREGA